MRTKCFLTAALWAVVMSVSAQVQVFVHDWGHGAICREKKLFSMEAGEKNPLWNIENYKKSGNKETFTLTPQEKRYDTYSCVMTLNGDTPTEMTLTSKQEGKKTYKLKVTDDEHLNNFYRETCGYAPMPSLNGGTPSAQDLKNGGVKAAAKNVGDAAKSTFGKVKGMFNKKKDKK